ncbi:hypothetical protein RJ55_02739 [Drechmeria coniospora]|nr:hypothetical protein RJ55_02739 [Drechmeria coniospora]
MPDESVAKSQAKPLVILCDGTWCGRETDTKTNLYLLARMVGIYIDDSTDTRPHVLDGRAWYMHGVGLGSTFMDAAQCIAAYRFLVDNYSYPDREIWMFGLSRGAFLVRSIAGMINNCGIVKRVMNADGSVNFAATDLLCRQVYSVYRSDDPIHAPHSPQSLSFRKNASWPLVGDAGHGDQQLCPPVKFMGLFDTVGNLGIPDFVGGVGLDWPRFHDQNVSTAVELVYHALSLHDRFYIFTPCLAKRKRQAGKPNNHGITQQWFPGVHYDLGRQRFRFLRMFGGGWLERLLARWGWASREIEPNEVLADLVLKWMLEAVRANDPRGEVIPTQQLDLEIAAANRRMVNANRRSGDGDVYQNIIAYAPFGTFTLRLLTTLWGTQWQTNQIYQLFFALRDRAVADLHSRVYDYAAVDPHIPDAHGRTVEELAGISNRRYPSRAYETWRLYRRILGTT